ncbi:hypothetical protein [Couchioplanes azureus]|uniref:hypothetical protein n=1 Tax=Couchioplanes caeruleus TaxID=56438 RepID=UPI001E2EA784|nr:hypothetical protein [Couchioplanes caeruleus]
MREHYPIRVLASVSFASFTEAGVAADILRAETDASFSLAPSGKVAHDFSVKARLHFARAWRNIQQRASDYRERHLDYARSPPTFHVLCLP